MFRDVGFGIRALGLGIRVFGSGNLGGSKKPDP